MKRITIDIEEDKAAFFEQLMNQLNFVKVQGSDFDIPEEHKKIVLDRIKNTREEEFLKWNDVKDKFRTK
jgi:hypothetical protein